MSEPLSPQVTLEIAADIVTAYVTKNAVRQADLPDLIQSVLSALTKVTSGQAVAEPAPPVPPVPVRRSITPDYLVSLEDGKQYRSLKRHLGTRGLTPDQYRAKWGLPSDYPMVAPNYARQRSELAKSIGLGQIRQKEGDVVEPAPTEAAPSPDQPKARRARKKT